MNETDIQKAPFKPRRGKRVNAIRKNIILQKGEIFFEIPDDGAGTGLGRIVMGDGVTPYEDLPYFTDFIEDTVLTAEPQVLTSIQQYQARTNIGAASSSIVSQLNSLLRGNIWEYNDIFTGRYLGVVNSGNIDSFFSELGISTSEYNIGLGDYFTIQDGVHNSDWMVAGIKNYMNKGNTIILNDHVTLINRTVLSNPISSSDNLCPMNSTNTTGVSKNKSNPLYNTTHGNETEGYQAYYGSDMNQIYIPNIIENLQQVLGNHLLQMNQLMSITMNMNASTGQYDTSGAMNGLPVNWGWKECYGILPNEIEIYGCKIWSNNGFDVGINCQQLPVFKAIPYTAFSRDDFWLRSIVSSARFAGADGNGRARYHSASNSYPIKLLICVK